MVVIRNPGNLVSYFMGGNQATNNETADRAFYPGSNNWGYSNQPNVRTTANFNFRIIRLIFNVLAHNGADFPFQLHRSGVDTNIVTITGTGEIDSGLIALLVLSTDTWCLNLDGITKGAGSFTASYTCWGQQQ